MRGFRQLSAFSLAFALSSAAAADVDLPARLNPIAICAPLVAAANAKSVPLDRIEPSSATELLTPGDSLSALVTFSGRDNRLTQWLLHVRSVEPDAKERSAKRAKPIVLYSSAGNKIEFEPSDASATLLTLGPYVETSRDRKGEPIEEKLARLTLDQTALAVGLDKTAVVMMRLKDLKLKGSIYFQSAPLSDAQAEPGRKLVQAAQITLEEERALAGSFPALVSFFSIVHETPGLSDIAMKILDRPSLWSVIRHGGVTANFQFRREETKPIDLKSWGLDKPAYSLPLVLMLNDQPALNVTLLVTSPNPPLLPCAGIVGVLAESPKASKEYLTIRVISARHAEKAPASEVKEVVPLPAK